MAINHVDLELLDRQATLIDTMEMYVAAVWRRGHKDELAEETLHTYIQAYRRSLARLSPEALFLYASRQAKVRRPQ